MDILDKVLAPKKAATKLHVRKAYTVRVDGIDLASRIVSRKKATKLAKRLRKAGRDAEATLFGMVNLKSVELHRFG